jgi:hypothetical protein
VDQISLPMRIALAASLVFAALWFVALRPKPVADVDGPLPTAERSAATPSAAEAAKESVSKASAARSTESRAAPAEPNAAEPATPAKGPKAVVADVKAGRTVVLLFWDPKVSSSDDRAVRRAVSDVDRHGGAVKVHVAELDDLKGYEPITQSAPILQSPTVLVIDRKARAHAIGGLTVTREIDALVDSALKVK